MAGKTRDLFQLERLAFFSDAVFAIAITLLVIEVKLPELDSFSDKALADALLSLISSYIGFAVSFFVIGRFWVGHHGTFSHLRTCDDGLVWRNLFFLFTIAFMPFPTAVISHYGGNRVAFGFYVGWLMLAGFFNRRLVCYALSNPNLLRDDDDPVKRLAHMHTSWAPIIIGAAAFGFSMIRPAYAFIPLFAAPFIVRAVSTLAHRRAKATIG
jgi:uncharacterized membrane protein